MYVPADSILTVGAKTPRITPSWVKTVGAMLDNGVRVRASCRKCQLMVDADLEAIACVKGRDFSLIGVEPKCRDVLCDGRCFFLYSPREGTPFRPLH